jgi:O-antigen ligase
MVTFSEAPARSEARPSGSTPLPMRTLSVIVEAGLWILLILTPLALGSVSRTATVLLEGACLALLALAWWAGMQAPASRVPRLFKGIAAGFVLWSLLQMVPLPSAALAILSPGTHRLLVENLPGYTSGAGPADVQAWLLQRRDTPSGKLAPRSEEKTGFEGKLKIPSRWRPISWYPGLTLQAVWRFLAYWAMFLLVADFLPENACRKRLPWLLALLGFGLAFQALLQKYTWNDRILWLVRVYQGTPFGPWVNRNHFAGYMEMTIPMGAALLLGTLGWGKTRRRRGGSRESAAPRVIVLLLLVSGMVAGLVASGSRGGVFSLCLTGAIYALAQAFFSERGGRGRLRLLLLGSLPILLMGAAIAVYSLRPGAFSLADKGASVEPSFGARLHAWKGILAMVQSNPITGTGLGTFGLAYPVFKSYGSTEIWDKAHNDYLQVLAESGIIGLALLFLGIASLARRYLIPALVRPLPRQDPVGLGAALGVLSLLLHALVEFNLQIPANGLLFVLLGGLLVRRGSAGSQPAQAP